MTITINNTSRNSNNNRIVWNIIYDNSISPNYNIITNFNSTYNFCSCTNQNIIT